MPAKFESHWGTSIYGIWIEWGTDGTGSDLTQIDLTAKMTMNFHAANMRTGGDVLLGNNVSIDHTFYVAWLNPDEATYDTANTGD